MTTIACDGKSMAGDGQADISDTIVATSLEKVWRLEDGSVFGFAGRSVDGPALASFLIKGGKRPSLKSCGALRLMPDRTIIYYNETAAATVIDAPAAVGSGADHALTAMDLGFSPREAVAAAERRDPFTGGKITVLDL